MSIQNNFIVWGHNKTVNDFQQFEGETVEEAWIRMKDILKNCYYHNLQDQEIIQSFYYGLNNISRDILDYASWENFLSNSTDESFQILEEKLLLNLNESTENEPLSNPEPIPENPNFYQNDPWEENTNSFENDSWGENSKTFQNDSWGENFETFQNDSWGENFETYQEDHFPENPNEPSSNFCQNTQWPENFDNSSNCYQNEQWGESSNQCQNDFCSENFQKPSDLSEDESNLSSIYKMFVEINQEQNKILEFLEEKVNEQMDSLQSDIQLNQRTNSPVSEPELPLPTHNEYISNDDDVITFSTYCSNVEDAGITDYSMLVPEPVEDDFSDEESVDDEIEMEPKPTVTIDDDEPIVLDKQKEIEIEPESIVETTVPDLPLIVYAGNELTSKKRKLEEASATFLNKRQGVHFKKFITGEVSLKDKSFKEMKSDSWIRKKVTFTIFSPFNFRSPDILRMGISKIPPLLKGNLENVKNFTNKSETSPILFTKQNDHFKVQIPFKKLKGWIYHLPRPPDQNNIIFHLWLSNLFAECRYYHCRPHLNSSVGEKPLDPCK